MIPGYELIEELPGTELFRLARGRRTENSQPVLVKTPHRDPWRPADIAALRRESEMFASFAIAGVPRPCTAELLHGCALVLEDPGGIPLASLLSSRRPDLGLVLAVGIQLAAILDELHRRGMAHNGIRPDAILCDAPGRRAWLIDFTDASGGTADSHASPALFLSAARLAYVSPERTGRMNRLADYRSDFYSLGVLLYELLTGVLPFRSTDVLELIHGHLARMPVAPSELDPAIPAPVSAIVLKLLAKTAEERYQSAGGLLADLRHCARLWSEKRCIRPFQLGQSDLSVHFSVPHRLYGRANELVALRQAFERSCQGPTVLALVTGYAGIGKTALIHELYRPIAVERGYFASGKFDQLSRDIPYGALIQALRQLIGQLLTEDPRRLGQRRLKIGQALGDNAGVVAELVPEISLIIGTPRPLAPLPPAEAQNRFALAFENFIAALAAPEQPLVLFLDDLQWADSATLILLQPLLSSPIQGLFLIGAYRDAEVGADHPLMQAVAALEAAGTPLARIILSPLAGADLGRLVAETLHADEAETKPLADLLLAKTGGNPFFVIQFLQHMHQERLIDFDTARARWTYQLESIQGAAMTDNVIELMTRKIHRLQPAAQRMLRLAACVGNRFDLQTLATISEQSPQVALADLAEAVAAGLILPAGNGDAAGFGFLHDRVQQAAYAQTPKAKKPALHLAIGRLLLARWERDRGEEKIFDIVSHINAGSALIEDDKERVTLAELNLAAGRRAKLSAAYRAALGYFEAGTGMLDESHWLSDYGLAFALHVEAVECEYLCGRFEEAEARFDMLLERAQSALDRAQVRNLRLLEYESLSRYGDAIGCGHEALASFGLEFPAGQAAREAALDSEVAAIHALVGGRDITQVGGIAATVEPMLEPELRMVMKLLTNLHTSCYLSGDKTLTMLNTARMVSLSLSHGNCEESAYAYALYAAMLVVPVQRDYQAAYEFGQLALRVNERFPAPAVRARVLMNLGWAVSLWRRPMSESIALSREAYRLGNANGMFVDATYALFNECWLSLLSCHDLAEFRQACSPHADYARRVGMRHFAAAPQIILQWGSALQGLTEQPTSLTDANFDEAAFRRDYRGQPLFEMFYCVAKLAVLYTFEDYRAAREVANQAEAIIRDFPGTIWDEQASYYHALTLAALSDQLTGAERPSMEERLAATAERLQRWAASSPENFRLPYLIVCAELARLRGDDSQAIDLYDTAVGTPSDCSGPLALANELYGKFWLRRRNAKVAGLYLGEAHALYGEWGAAAKQRQLEQRYGGVIDTSGGTRVGTSGAAHRPNAGGVGRGDALDIATVLKAAHALSAEVVLGDLLKRLLGIAMESAGARRGLLIEERGGEFYAAAEATADPAQVTLLESAPLASTPPRCSSAVINYVHRTGTSLVVDDAVADERFAADAYISAARPQSLLCMPIVHQAKFSALLYLENDLASGAFTPQRIETLRVLSVQAAIALENARLFDAMKREIAQRQQAEAALQQALTELSELKDRLEEENVYLRRDLIANVSHDLRTPLASMRGYLDTLLMKEASLKPEKRRAYLEIAARQCERLGALVADLFELTKLDIRDVEIHAEPVQLGELAQDIVQKFELAAEKKAVVLKADMAADMPSVLADIGLIERVLENLIRNALEHTTEGDEVHLCVIPGEQRVIVRVRDTGGGIPAADLPHIFERSYRGEKSRRRSADGAGLGLAIAKRIVELHGGEITVESKPMVGTCFSFSLPVQPATTQ